MSNGFRDGMKRRNAVLAVPATGAISLTALAQAPPPHEADWGGAQHRTRNVVSVDQSHANYRLVAERCDGASGSALAQRYPSKPMTVIPAFPPGAPHDFVMRLVGEPFLAAYKQPLVIENKPGAGGNIGAEAVVRAAPDGYTLLATVDTVVTVNPRPYRNLSFKADVDLVPVIYRANSAQTRVCHPSVPVKSVSELVAYAKSRDMSYASGGPQRAHPRRSWPR